MPIEMAYNQAERRYRTADGTTVGREFHGTTPEGNPLGGRWVVRDEQGAFVDVEQYRTELASRFHFVFVPTNCAAGL